MIPYLFLDQINGDPVWRRNYLIYHARCQGEEEVMIFWLQENAGYLHVIFAEILQNVFKIFYLEISFQRILYFYF